MGAPGKAGVQEHRPALRLWDEGPILEWCPPDSGAWGSGVCACVCVCTHARVSECSVNTQPQILIPFYAKRRWIVSPEKSN